MAVLMESKLRPSKEDSTYLECSTSAFGATRLLSFVRYRYKGRRMAAAEQKESSISHQPCARRMSGQADAVELHDVPESFELAFFPVVA